MIEELVEPEVERRTAPVLETANYRIQSKRIFQDDGTPSPPDQWHSTDHVAATIDEAVRLILELLLKTLTCFLLRAVDAIGEEVVEPLRGKMKSRS